ncbi:MAG: hypothetical protein MHM6MM_002583 [Cercozoa sp. M6MM]
MERDECPDWTVLEETSNECQSETEEKSSAGTNDDACLQALHSWTHCATLLRECMLCDEETEQERVREFLSNLSACLASSRAELGQWLRANAEFLRATVTCTVAVSVAVLVCALVGSNTHLQQQQTRHVQSLARAHATTIELQRRNLQLQRELRVCKMKEEHQRLLVPPVDMRMSLTPRNSTMPIMQNKDKVRTDSDRLLAKQLEQKCKNWPRILLNRRRVMRRHDLRCLQRRQVRSCVRSDKLQAQLTKLFQRYRKRCLH